MTISERMFRIMDSKGITQTELSRLTGISTRTISDWKRKKTNPGADKILIICVALEITPEELLAGDTSMVEKKTGKNTVIIGSGISEENVLIDGYRELPANMQRRLMAYLSMLQNIKE